MSGDRHDHGHGSHFFDTALRVQALEKPAGAKALTGAAELAHRKGEWDAAARATPRGRPIVLR